MTTPVGQKKASTDWHPADVVAALWKRKTTLRRLSRQNGYAAGALQIALRRPWPKAERIIAEAISVTPQAIWPSRYNADGTSNRSTRARPAMHG